MKIVVSFEPVGRFIESIITADWFIDMMIYIVVIVSAMIFIVNFCAWLVSVLYLAVGPFFEQVDTMKGLNYTYWMRNWLEDEYIAQVFSSMIYCYVIIDIIVAPILLTIILFLSGIITIQ